MTCRRFIADLDAVDESLIYDMAIEEYFEYIERQRLTYMPHRGSHWDKVLKWAELFGLQISTFANTVEPFVVDSKLAAKLVWTACRSLLDVRITSPLIKDETDNIIVGSRQCPGTGDDVRSVLQPRPVHSLPLAP